MYTPKLKSPSRTSPAPDIFDNGQTSCSHEAEKDGQDISESMCCAKELEEEKQPFARREDLKSETEPALNVFAPIKQLSHDVLCHVFELHCKDSLCATLPRSSLRRRPVPPQITLSHVCLAWREIMLDVPKFWRNIKIKIIVRNVETSEAIDRTVEAANTWLSRAKGLPCSIDIDFPQEMSLWDMDWHDNIIRDLISLHKFKNLGVTFADHHLRELLQLPDDKLSCIEDLCLRYVSYISMIEDDTESPLDLHKLSNLRSFSLLPHSFDLCSLGDAPEDYSELAGIPWHNLRHIQLRAIMPTSFCLYALEHCSILETCSLVINDDYTFPSLPRVPVHLFQLRNLEVIVYPTEEEILDYFLLSLRFPNLKSLTLSPCDYHIDVELLLRVQNTSQIQLEELIILESTLDIDIDVRTLLIGFPSLRRLELPHEVTFTDKAMIEVGAGSVGVSLEHLTLKDSALDLETLLQMVKARSHASNLDSKHGIEVTEFKSVTFHRDEAEGDMEDEIFYLIEEIKRSGVDLNVVFADI